MRRRAESSRSCSTTFEAVLEERSGVSLAVLLDCGRRELGHVARVVAVEEVLETPLVGRAFGHIGGFDLGARGLLLFLDDRLLGLEPELLVLLPDRPESRDQNRDRHEDPEGDHDESVEILSAGAEPVADPHEDRHDEDVLGGSSHPAHHPCPERRELEFGLIGRVICHGCLPFSEVFEVWNGSQATKRLSTGCHSKHSNREVCRKC